MIIKLHFIPLTFCGLSVFLLYHMLTQRKAKQVCTESARLPVNRLILVVIHPCDFPSSLPFILLQKASCTNAILLSPPVLQNPSWSNQPVRFPFTVLGSAVFLHQKEGRSVRPQTKMSRRFISMPYPLPFG